VRSVVLIALLPHLWSIGCTPQADPTAELNRSTQLHDPTLPASNDPGAIPHYSIRFTSVSTPAQVDTSATGGWTETSPWTIPLTGEHGYLVSTNYTMLCSSAEALPDVSGSALDVDQCTRVLAGGTTDLPPPEDITAPEWARNYYGAFTAHALRPDDPDSPLLVFAHGENKNEDLGGILYTNTINTDATDYSGYDDTGFYVDAWDAYNAFIGSTVFATPSAAFTDGPSVTDNGPVVWPSTGYLDATGAKTSEGVRHPSSIVFNGFVYLFYLDESHGDDPDRHAGIKVARAPLDRAGAPGSFFAFYAGGFGEPALPIDYSVSRLHAALAQPGPRTTAILGLDSANDVRFSVAQVVPSPSGAPLFVGVEEHGGDDDGTGWWVALRLSANLTDWSAPVQVPGIAAATWEDGSLNYPIFLDENGTTNTTISPNGFYLVGTHDSQTNLVHIAIELVPAG
jgi:hypothetical protein